MSENRATCFVCQKHRGEISAPGGTLLEDDLVYAGHSIIDEGQDSAYLGVLFVEPKRHVPEMADLTEREAARIGVVASRASRALRESEGAERVYMFVLGHHVPHLHIWLVPRYPGTPEEVVGMDVLTWSAAPYGGEAEIDDLCTRLRAALA